MFPWHFLTTYIHGRAYYTVHVYITSPKQVYIYIYLLNFVSKLIICNNIYLHSAFQILEEFKVDINMYIRNPFCIYISVYLLVIIC